MACMCLMKLHVIKALSKLAPLYDKVLSGGILQMGTHPLLNLLEQSLQCNFQYTDKKRDRETLESDVWTEAESQHCSNWRLQKFGPNYLKISSPMGRGTNEPYFVKHLGL